MSLFSLMRRLPIGGRNPRRAPQHRARLGVNGIDRLDERVHPSLWSVTQGLLNTVVQTADELLGNDDDPPPPPNDDGGSTANASLSGTAFIDWNSNQIYDDGDAADVSVTVTLTGTDDLGNAVFLETTTDADGNYSFAGLRAGTYSLSFSSPSGDGSATVGTAGGTQSSESSSTIVDITLASGAQAANYNYAVAPQAS